MKKRYKEIYTWPHKISAVDKITKRQVWVTKYDRPYIKSKSGKTRFISDYRIKYRRLRKR